MALLRRTSRKGKKVIEEVQVKDGPRNTRGSQQKLISDTMEANKSQTLRNRRKRRRIVVEDLVLEGGVIDITLDEEGIGDKDGDKRKEDVSAQKNKGGMRRIPSKKKSERKGQKGF